jgi:hypothetical protein
MHRFEDIIADTLSQISPLVEDLTDICSLDIALSNNGRLIDIILRGTEGLANVFL